MGSFVSNRDGGKTDEKGHYKFQVKVWSGNVVSGLLASQNSPLGMSVLLSQGDLKIDYSDYAYTGWTDSNTAVTIAGADGSNPRIDRIVAYIDRGMPPSSASPDNPGMLKFMSVAGTPASSPSRPSDGTVNSAVGASNPWCDIADVRVNSGVTTITSSNVTDTRVPVSVSSSSLPQTALQGWLPFPVTSLTSFTRVDANTMTVNLDMTFLSAGDKIRLDNTSTKYFYVKEKPVLSSGVCTILLQAGSEYTLAAATAITNVSYSKASSPTGFPSSFSIAPALTGFSVLPDYVARFSVNGGLARIMLQTVNAGTSNAGTVTAKLPFLAKNVTDFYQWGIGHMFNNAGYAVGRMSVNPNSDILNIYSSMNGDSWFSTGSKFSTFEFSWFIKE